MHISHTNKYFFFFFFSISFCYTLKKKYVSVVNKYSYSKDTYTLSGENIFTTSVFYYLSMFYCEEPHLPTYFCENVVNINFMSLFTSSSFHSISFSSLNICCRRKYMLRCFHSFFFLPLHLNFLIIMFIGNFMLLPHE